MKKMTLISLNCMGVPFNINHKARFKLLVANLLKIKPDIALLQEVIFYNDFLFLETELKQAGYKFYCFRNGILVAGGLVIISKYILTDVNYTRFSNQGNILNFFLGDIILGKGFLTAKLTLEGKSVYFIDVHCLFPYTTAFDPIMKQIRQLSQSIKRINSESLLVAGDFNVDIKDKFRSTWLLDELNLKDYIPSDVFTIDPLNLNRKGKPMSLLSGNAKIRPDYLLVGTQLNVKHVNLIFEKPINTTTKQIHISDHYGVIAEFEF